MLTTCQNNNSRRVAAHVCRESNIYTDIYTREEVEADDIIVNRNNLVSYIDPSWFYEGRYPINVGIVEAIYFYVHSNRTPPETADPIVKEYYTKVMHMINKLLPTVLYACVDYYFCPMPTSDPDQRNSIIMSGPSGAGKSTTNAKFLRGYHKAYPNRIRYLFSSKTEDKPYDNEGLVRIKQEDWEEFMNRDIEVKIGNKKKKKRGFKDIKEWRESCFTFDDIENASPAEDREMIMKFKKYIVQLGRAFHIDVIDCNHLLFRGNETREDLNECTAIVLFPKFGTPYHISRYLSVHLPFKVQTINTLLYKTRRWLMIVKSYPITVVTEYKIWIIHT